MNVGIDFWPGATHEPGVGRYLRELVAALAELDDAPRIALLDWGRGARLRTSDAAVPAGRSHGRSLRVGAPRAWLHALARVGLGADRLLGGCELVHGVLAGEPPVSRARRTLAVAELPPDPRVLGAYDGLLTFSSHARDELAARSGVEFARIHVVEVGCEHFARGPALERAQAETVLVLGRVDHARGPLEVLAACERLRARGRLVRLHFLGRHGNAYDELRARVTRSPMSSSVGFDSEPDDRKVRAALHSAHVLAQLAQEDLTPVTPLEALACGAAVVARRLPAYVEALGPRGARWIDSDEPEALACALEQALADAADPRTAAARSALAATFSWKRHATATLAAWRRVLAQA